MTASSPSLPRRLAALAALAVPLVVDPYGGDTQATKALVLALCGGAALVLEGGELLLGRPATPRAPASERLLAVLAAWAALSLAWATNPELGTTRVLLLLGMLGVARTVRAACRGPQSARRWLVGVLVVGAAAMAIDAVLVAQGRGRLEAAAVKYASVLFVHNNMAAAYATLLAPLAAALALGRAGSFAARLPWLLYLAGLSGYLLLLRSRAGLLGAVFGVAVVVALHLVRRRLEAGALRRRAVVAAAGVLVAAGALLPFSDAARGLAKDAFYRVVATADLGVGDAAFRTEIWGKTIPMVRAAPLTGVGAGNWVVEFPRYEHYPERKPHAHNDMLQVLAELGLPGLALFLGLIAATAYALLVVLASAGGKHAFRVAAGLLGLLVVFVVGGVFEVPFALAGTAAVLSVAIGLAGALGAPRPAPVPHPRAARVVAALGVLAGGAGCVLASERLPAGALAARAERELAAGRPDEAARTYLDLAAHGTGAALPYDKLAELALERGDGEAALEHVRAARRLSPWEAQLAEREGDALLVLGRAEDAVAAYREALEASPARKTALYKLVRALDEAGDLQRAIDELEYEVRVNTGITLDAVANLAEMYRRRAEELSGPERTRALVAARHFCAVLLQDGPPERREAVDGTFGDLTHRLQILPGGLDAWWPVYMRFLDQGGWNMPPAALYTSVGPGGIKLFPGWEEPLGPPAPGSWRRP